MIKMSNLREAYGKELVALGRKNERIVVLDADLRGSTMSCYFAHEFPERFFEMGIAEQNMISTAAGLSLVGKIPFVNTFAVFATGRPYDQIRQGVALPKLNVKIVGSSCGLSDYGDGATHQSVEDMAIMRSIPNMVIISPVDAIEMKKIVKVVVEYQGPVYIRINRNDLPVLTDEDESFEIGKINKIADGKDITIFATGFMVYQALQARAILQDKGISVRVINVSTIKPIDVDKVREYANDVKGVITAEEHSIIGGLGGAICEVLSDELVKIKRVGIDDKFGQSASNYEELINYYSLTPQAIVEKAEELLNSVR
jgi:transketolase